VRNSRSFFHWLSMIAALSVLYYLYQGFFHVRYQTIFIVILMVISLLLVLAFWLVRGESK